MNSKNFLIKTHGCKTNQLESAVIAEKLAQSGYVQVKKLEEAGIFILNSCSVTSNADDEALRQIRHAKHVNSGIITVLTGCSAQLKSQELKNLEFIDIIAGNNDKFEIPELLAQKINKVTDIFKISDFNNQFVHDYAKTRGYLKIQDGCNNYCSYCTIPFARGNCRSNSAANIIEQINNFHENGIKEVVLTGIHIGQWGVESGKTLLNLLEKIEKTPIPRYRLGSLNPLEMDDELLKFLAQSGKFCPHFHLSLQSLTDKTLENMNRHYSAELCLELIDKLNGLFRLPFLGSDIIAGFPGETEEDFATTLENVQKSGLSNVHVFPYSLRKNTKAAEMTGHLPLKIKKERAQLLKNAAKEKFEKFVAKNTGTEQEVLIEKHPDKKTGMLKGVTKNYLNVYCKNTDKSLLNTIQTVKIVKSEPELLFFSII